MRSEDETFQALPSEAFASEDRERIVTRVPSDDLEFNLAEILGEELASKSVVTRLLGDAPAKPESSDMPQGDGTKYAMGDEVGRGGMGRIVQAKDNDLNRQVAMKVLLDKEAGLRRFIEEAQITGQLEHPNVLPVHDFGINSEGELFFTMQYVRGNMDLRSVIDRLIQGDPATHEQFTWERRVQIIQHVCHALQYAHERGVIHRDIKPDNIMLGSLGEVFLVDWGVARCLDAAPAKEEEAGPLPVETLRKDDVHRTQRGAWVGTPRYMSPEQILGLRAEVDTRSDLYALAAVLYELLSLNHYLGPWTGEVNALVASIVHRKPEDAESHLSPHNGRVPRNLSRICRKGLSKRKDDRYATALELERDLQLWIEGRSPIVCPGTFIQRNLARFSDLIDLRPTLVPAVTIFLLIVLLALATLGAVLGVRSLMA